MEPASVHTGLIGFARHKVAGKGFKRLSQSDTPAELVRLAFLSGICLVGELIAASNFLLLLRVCSVESSCWLVKLIGNHLLKLVLRSENFLEESSSIPDGRSVFDVTLLSRELAEADLSPRKVVL